MTDHVTYFWIHFLQCVVLNMVNQI